MALYLISYDIDEKNKDEYEPLWAFLRKIKAVKILYSEWIVESPVAQAASIYNEIAPIIKANDRLLVQELHAEAAWDKLLIGDDEFKTIVLRAARN